nr:ribonuclease H-like domain-containing protein [Tanacetum cinerariifolium]
MTGNKSCLTDYEECDGGFVAFAGSSKGGKITGKGKIRTGKFDYKDVYFVKEFKFNLFSVSQMCDKKNSVLFTDTECFILSPNFMLPDESQVLLKVPRKNNMYSFDLKNVVPSKGLTCLFTKATNDESNLWHRRLGHINYKTMNKLVKGNLVRGSETNFDAGQAGKEKVPDQEYILLPLLNTCSNVPSSYKEAESSPKDDVGKKLTAKTTCVEGGKTKNLGNGSFQRTNDEWDFSTPIIVNAAGSSFSHPAALDDYSKMTILEDISIFGDAYDDRDEGVEADYNNLETVISVIPIPSTRIHKDHPKEQIIGEVEAMQEELLQFKLLNVWTLVDLPHGKRAFGTKWVYRNKRDQRQIVVRNKARLVAQGHRQEEGMDYDEVFALVARIEAIRAWYETLSTYLLENGFKRGTIDKTLFIKQIKNDILLVQVYVDDIIFGSTKMSLSIEFEQLMHKRFKMSSMGELTFFLGLQTKIHVDNESAICVVKNHVYHSKTKRIEIRHHFIRDSYEKRLIEMVKIHIDYNVADLLTKAFDVTSSKTINSMKQIHATIDGKVLVISESSVISDLLFDDEDGIICLTNDEIFENLSLMGYEPLSTKFTDV